MTQRSSKASSIHKLFKSRHSIYSYGEGCITFGDVGAYLDLPLDEQFPRVEGEHDHQVRADDGESVAFLVEGEAGFEAQAACERQRRLGRPVLAALFAVPVELHMDAVWKDTEQGKRKVELSDEASNVTASEKASYSRIITQYVCACLSGMEPNGIALYLYGGPPRS